MGFIMFLFFYLFIINPKPKKCNNKSKVKLHNKAFNTVISSTVNAKASHLPILVLY